MSASLSPTPEWEFPDKLEFLFESHRYKVAYGGRGGAKSWGFARALLIQAWQKRIRVLCTREVQNSIRDSVHKLLCDQIEALGLGSFFEVTRDEIRGQNGSEFVFAGLSNLTSESIKSYEGVDKCWVEEAHKVRQRSWDILIPTIRKEDSEIWVSMNPELDTDDSYVRFIENPPASAKVVYISYQDNPWFPSVLEEERQEFLRQVQAGKRTQDDYDNIWEGRCRAAVYGAIYGKDLMRVREQKRITTVPWDPSKLVFTAWDLGKGDSTAIWFWQEIAGEIRVIDYFEDNGEDLPYYLQKLESKGYRYSTIWLPHDAADNRIGHPKTIEQQVRSNGYKVQIVPKLSLEAGINAARLLLARCLFDEKRCGPGLETLRHYKWGYNQALDELKPTPVHDWASHGADAFRYLAVSLRDEKPAFRKPQKIDRRGIV